jgi:pimeloyl-ACP methyl ester carboxylesterase
MIVLIFVHGFLGGAESTFLNFPTTIAKHATTLLHKQCKSIVYPSYSTSGNIQRAVDKFIAWLCALDEWPNDDFVLCGHSMGGILIADALLKLKGENVKGIIALDTPFYGISGKTFTSKLDLAGKVVSKLVSPSTSSSNSGEESKESTSRVKLMGGILAATIAAGAVAFLAKDKIAQGVTTLGNTVGEHIDFLDPLAQEADLQHTRVESILQTRKPFKCLYIQLLDKNRTFIVLPPDSTRDYFRPVKTVASDEADGHMSMFDPDATMLKEFGSESLLAAFLETLWDMFSPMSTFGTKERSPSRASEGASSARGTMPERGASPARSASPMRGTSPGSMPERGASPSGRRVLLRDGTIAYII